MVVTWSNVVVVQFMVRGEPLQGGGAGMDEIVLDI
jgi:hypothetical protein